MADLANTRYTLPGMIGKLPAPVAPTPAIAYRGLRRVSAITPCVLSIGEIRRLYSDLDRKAQEAIKHYIASLQPPANMSDEEFKAAKALALEIGHVTVAIQGTAGEQVVQSSIEGLNEEGLPHRVTSIEFDSTSALQQHNANLHNRFHLRLDFAEQSTFTSYDPWNQPTPNSSQVEVVGPDDTWVTAVHQTVLEFVKRHRRRRGWIHSAESFSLLNWLFGIPAAMWVAYRVDTTFVNTLPNIHSALRGALDLYFFLVGLMLFRGIIYGLRWLYPVIELEGSRSKAARATFGIIATSLVTSFLYDVLRVLISGT